MLLFLKGFVVGIGKIIPGVSGAMLAINFNVYEDMLEAVTNFFSDWKKNLKKIAIFGSGIVLSIVLGSGLILYLLNNFKFITMMFFIGLILGGTYNFSLKVNYNYKNILLIGGIILLLLIFSIISFDATYILRDNFFDKIVFFAGGYIDIFASIVPGISGTSLLMVMGIYNDVLKMMSSIFDINYIISNIGIYISYGLGMFLSFIINSYLINYLLKKYRNISYIIILGLSISSILFLFYITFNISFNILEIVIGIMLLVIGLLFSSILDK